VWTPASIVASAHAAAGVYANAVIEEADVATSAAVAAASAAAASASAAAAAGVSGGGRRSLANREGVPLGRSMDDAHVPRRLLDPARSTLPERIAWLGAQTDPALARAARRLFGECGAACTNCALTAGRQARMALCVSDGFGAVNASGRPLLPGDAIGDYAGQLVSDLEADRRGVVYDSGKSSSAAVVAGSAGEDDDDDGMDGAFDGGGRDSANGVDDDGSGGDGKGQSYLFDQKGQDTLVTQSKGSKPAYAQQCVATSVVDACLAGNKTRFLNDSRRDKARQNVVAENWRAPGLRVLLKVTAPVPPGVELRFDYGYGAEQERKFYGQQGGGGDDAGDGGSSSAAAS
jgi:hypothetical protein